LTGQHPKNVGGYFGYIDECQYLNGVVAGRTTKTKKLGFIAVADPAGAQEHQRVHDGRAHGRSEDHDALIVTATGPWGQGGGGRQ
jgi:hypothetical protein